MLLAWAAAALGVLTKGLVAAAIPAAVLILYSLYARDFAPWRRLHAAVGLPLFLADHRSLALACGAAAAGLPAVLLRARASGALLDADCRSPGGLVVLRPWCSCSGSVPWTLPALRVLAAGWRRRAPPRRIQSRALSLDLGACSSCVFFSLSDSKLIPYILPAMPALAC